MKNLLTKLCLFLVGVAGVANERPRAAYARAAGVQRVI